MRILITGNMGYVGPVVAAHLRRRYPNAELIGYDSGLFASQLTTADPFPERVLTYQYFGDIRDIREEQLRGFDTVVHLSAISNDPMGNKFERPTIAINQEASLRVARLSADAGVRTFVFASSCSVYGSGSETPRSEGDALNPLTAYAHSKIGTEIGLSRLVETGTDMTITCLRFATARGMSPRLRLDLVLNDFVASAVWTKQITVLSDGTPWRPLIDVADMARAIEWAIERSEGTQFLTVNTGSDDQNFTVSELANTVAAKVPGTHVSINTNAPPDKRSYRVDFSLFQGLAPNHQPRVSLPQSIAELVIGVSAQSSARATFRQSDAMRLFTLERHLYAGQLDDDIRWTNLNTTVKGS